MFGFLRNASQSWLVRIVFALLILVFVFFGIGSVLFTPPEAFVTVNGYTITQAQFFERLQQEEQYLLQRNPTWDVKTLEQLGIRKQVYMQMVMQLLVLEEAKKMGLAISNERLRKEIMQLPIFRTEEGKFNAEAYREAVKNNRGRILQFENSLRDDLLVQTFSRMLSQTAFVAPQLAKNIFNFFYETRTVGYKLFPVEQYLAKITVSKQEVEDFYKKESKRWEEPLRVDATYIVLDAAKIADTVSIPQERINAAYEAEKVQYSNVSEKEAKEQIAKKMIQKATEKQVEELLEKSQIAIAEGKTLESIAPAIHSEVYSAEHLTIAELARTMDIPKEILARQVENTEPTLEPVQQDNNGGYVFFAINKKIPAGIAPLEEVEKDVKETLIQQKAFALAQKDAEALIAKSKTGGLPSDTFEKTVRFSRKELSLDFPVPGEEVIKALFDAPVHTILERAYEAPEGFVVLQVQDQQFPSEKQWEADQDSFSSDVKGLYTNMLLDGYQRYLWNTAKIELHLPELLEPQVVG